ncbi:MAG TPA: LON peptidase substrate-binding domain-containing protein [Candidatus Kapabacteria bacterium]|nr:LON peptidase substrate-binding domain-containing protein [Candidatus Kapabacteria bacterium]
MILGLFPLNIVLFPESVYPLHIYEDRYKALIKECYEQNKAFGINFLTSLGMSNIGCSAKVSDIFKSYPDGKMDILVVGEQRFKIISMQDGSNPYYTADVDFFDDDIDTYSVSKLYECTEIFNDVVSKIKSINIDRIEPDELSTKYPSFLIAQKSGLGAEQKQALIEIRSEDFRLDYLIKHLKRLTPMIMQTETINQIIRNDGYIKPNL